MKALQAIAAHLGHAEGSGVLATLTSVEGSSYRRAGARMLITETGHKIGSVSGGCLEEDLIERAKSVASSGRAEVVTYDTTAENDLVWGVGLGCHGIVRLLLEPVGSRPPWVQVLSDNLASGLPTELAVCWDARKGPLGTRLGGPAPCAYTKGEGGVFCDRIAPPACLTIFGAGDDAQPLARLAQELGWRVTVADPRPAMPTEGRFPGAQALVSGPADTLVARTSPRVGSLAVVMTHHYCHDVPLIHDLLPLDLAYLGLLGPKKRSEKILSDLEAAGLAVTPPMRSRLHAPVGLDIGAEGPEEVALSIIAEMNAALAGRDARPLRDRVLPIHA